MEKLSLPKNVLEIIDSLESLKKDWKDGVPEETIHSTSPDSKFKVRKAYFQIINIKFICELPAHG